MIKNPVYTFTSPPKPFGVIKMEDGHQMKII